MFARTLFLRVTWLICARAQVLQCRVMTDAYSRGCLNAQVVLESKFDVLKCINALHGVRYEGQQLDVRKVTTTSQ